MNKDVLCEKEELEEEGSYPTAGGPLEEQSLWKTFSVPLKLSAAGLYKKFGKEKSSCVCSGMWLISQQIQICIYSICENCGC
jgi:hypothetical protein